MPAGLFLLSLSTAGVIPAFASVSPECSFGVASASCTTDKKNKFHARFRKIFEKRTLWTVAARRN